MKFSRDFRVCPYHGDPLQLRGGQRPRCPRCGFVDFKNPCPCVAVLIFDERKLLLSRRAVQPNRGAWDIPGGFIEPDESAEDAAIREAFEETALTIRIIAYLGSVPDVYGPREVPTLNLCFVGEITGGTLRAQSDVAELVWKDIDRLPRQMAFAHQRTIACWARAFVRAEFNERIENATKRSRCRSASAAATATGGRKQTGRPPGHRLRRAD